MSRCVRTDGCRMQSNRCFRRYAHMRRSSPVASKSAVPSVECLSTLDGSRLLSSCRTRARCTRFGTCIDSFDMKAGGRGRGVGRQRTGRTRVIAGIAEHHSGSATSIAIGTRWRNRKTSRHIVPRSTPCGPGDGNGSTIAGAACEVRHLLSRGWSRFSGDVRRTARATR